MTFSVTPVPCLKDNYAYLVRCDATGAVAVVDPSEVAPVRAALASLGATPTAVWATHHHLDHVGGIEGLVAEAPGVPVYGHASDRGRIPGQTVFLDDDTTFTLGRLLVRALHVPGHTSGAVAYLVSGQGTEGGDAVFTGDTLFLAGCGRLFEGTAATMHASLRRLAALPGSTRVYCGHEYTAANLRFAAHLEPSSRAIADRVARLVACTVPGTLEEERATNPFLRVESSELRATLGIAEEASPADAFAIVREAKNNFR